MSAKTGFAPTSEIASAVAKYVNGVVITVSPDPIPNALKDKTSASVPELQLTVYFEFKKFLLSSSNLFTFSPKI